MRTLQIYATGSATASAVAQVTIPAAAKIRGVLFGVAIDSVTDNTRVFFELSKIPTNQFGVNGSQEPFAVVGGLMNVAANGQSWAGINQFVPVDVDCRQGEIIYFHAYVNGTATYYGNVILVYG